MDQPDKQKREKLQNFLPAIADLLELDLEVRCSQGVSPPPNPFR